MITVITSAGLTEDLDAPQVFTFARALEAHDFIAQAPRTGWAYDEATGGLVTAAVRFSVYDETGADVTAEAVAAGWLARCEAR
jgi:hypothetical protein